MLTCLIPLLTDPSSLTLVQQADGMHGAGVSQHQPWAYEQALQQCVTSLAPLKTVDEDDQDVESSDMSAAPHRNLHEGAQAPSELRAAKVVMPLLQQALC